MRGDESFAEQMARIDALFADAKQDQAVLAKRAVEAASAVQNFAILQVVDSVCDYSYLRESQCAHCCGHKLDPDLEEVVDA